LIDDKFGMIDNYHLSSISYHFIYLASCIATINCCCVALLYIQSLFEQKREHGIKSCHAEGIYTHCKQHEGRLAYRPLRGDKLLFALPSYFQSR